MYIQHVVRFTLQKEKERKRKKERKKEREWGKNILKPNKRQFSLDIIAEQIEDRQIDR